jgi:hypothetical protein
MVAGWMTISTGMAVLLGRLDGRMSKRSDERVR